MEKIELYSERQRKLRGEVPTVYTYDEIPEPLRVQIIHIWGSSVPGSTKSSLGYHNRLLETCEQVVTTLHREYGVFTLPGNDDLMYRPSRSSETNYFNILIRFLISVEDVEKVLDSIELFFNTAEQRSRGSDDRQAIEQGIEELNSRFKQHGVGYQFKNGQILRIDSEFTHSEIVEPTLRLLNQEIYSGAQKEFLKAHKHYLKGNHEEALNECLKTFESVMKIICEKRGWKHSKNSSASQLIETCFNNKLIPEFWQSHYESLQNLLKTGIPTARNESAAHGRGSGPRQVSDHLVAYVLHTTASTILFLAEAEKNLPQANAN